MVGVPNPFQIDRVSVREPLLSTKRTMILGLLKSGCVTSSDFVPRRFTKYYMPIARPMNDHIAKAGFVSTQI